MTKYLAPFHPAQPPTNVLNFDELMEMLILKTYPGHDVNHKCTYRDMLYNVTKMDYMHNCVEKLASKFSLVLFQHRLTGFQTK